eukprot:71527_1
MTMNGSSRWSNVFSTSCNQCTTDEDCYAPYNGSFNTTWECDDVSGISMCIYNECIHDNDCNANEKCFIMDCCDDNNYFHSDNYTYNQTIYSSICVPDDICNTLKQDTENCYVGNDKNIYRSEADAIICGGVCSIQECKTHQFHYYYFIIISIISVLFCLWCCVCCRTYSKHLKKQEQNTDPPIPKNIQIKMPYSDNDSDNNSSSSEMSDRLTQKRFHHLNTYSHDMLSLHYHYNQTNHMTESTTTNNYGESNHSQCDR